MGIWDAGGGGGGGVVGIAGLSICSEWERRTWQVTLWSRWLLWGF